MARCWRLQLDVPHDFVVEPGYFRGIHSHDMRVNNDPTENVWKDPITGLVMLKPSFLDEYWLNGLKGLSNWTKVASFWEEIKPVQEASATSMAVLSTVNPSPGSNTSGWQLTSLMATIGIFAILSAITDDTLSWALESTFTLADDEGFVLYYRAMSHELRRHRNLMQIQWDNIGLHLGMDGILTVTRYNRASMSTTPELVEQLAICSPSELANREGYFYFIPVPDQGLLIYHSRTAQRLTSANSSAQAGSVRGHLIKWDTEDDGSGHRRLFRSSKIAVGLNHSGKILYNIGVHTISYAASGNYNDSRFDPGFKPSVAPASVAAIVLPTGRGSVSATLRNADNTGAWSAGTDRQGVIQLALSTSDSKYTPFVLGTYCYWDPIRATRATTAVEPYSVQQIEITEDDLGRWEGSASLLLSGAAQEAIAERGDTTWQLDYTDDPEAPTPTYTTFAGGIARLEQDAAYKMDEGGGYYQTGWTLHGMEYLFGESHALLNSAFDGVTIADAINVILRSAGFAAITITGAATTTTIPAVPEGENWRYGVQMGDSGEDMIRTLLFLLRRKNVEWRLRYDWSGGGWVMEQKPRDTSAGATWTLTPFEDEEDVPSRIVMMGGGKDGFAIRVRPPEFNQFQPFGISGTNPNKANLVPGTPLVNPDSISDTSSPDYLGRVVYARPYFAEVTDVAEINLMGRRVFDAACHRRLIATIPLRDWHDGLAPATQVIVRGFTAGTTTRTDKHTLWVRRRTLRLDLTKDTGAAPGVEIVADSVWESGVDE